MIRGWGHDPGKHLAINTCLFREALKLGAQLKLGLSQAPSWEYEPWIHIQLNAQSVRAVYSLYKQLKLTLNIALNLRLKAASFTPRCFPTHATTPTKVLSDQELHEGVLCASPQVL